MTSGHGGHTVQFERRQPRYVNIGGRVVDKRPVLMVPPWPCIDLCHYADGKRHPLGRFARVVTAGPLTGAERCWWVIHGQLNPSQWDEEEPACVWIAEGVPTRDVAAMEPSTPADVSRYADETARLYPVRADIRVREYRAQLGVPYRPGRRWRAYSLPQLRGAVPVLDGDSSRLEAFAVACRRCGWERETPAGDWSRLLEAAWTRGLATEREGGFPVLDLARLAEITSSA